MKTFYLSIFIILILMLISSCSKQNINYQNNINTFIDDIPTKLNISRFEDINSLINTLGKPLKIESENVENIHNKLLDVLYTIYYKDLIIYTYYARAINESFVTHIEITNKIYKFHNNICVGSKRSNVKEYLGEPTGINNEYWIFTYKKEGDYEHTLSITFSDDVVTKIDVSYEVD